VARTRGRWLVLGVVAWAAVALAAVTLAEDGAHESIRVHGQWKIEVFDPDGTRVSVTEFENALVDQNLIPLLMSGQVSYGGWGISLEGGPVGLCLYTDGDEGPCNIGAEGVYYGGIQLHSTNLTVVADPGAPGTVVLQGSVTAGLDGSVDAVGTRFNLCPGDVAPTVCVTQEGAEWREFTRATISPGTPVVAGQLIQVSVTLSFTS
jgi:hypothetical protein